MTDAAGSEEIPVDATFITAMPPATRAMVAGIVVGACAGFSAWAPTLMLHPRTLLGGHVWTLATYPFVDTSVLNVLISLLSIPIFGKLLENLYGTAALTRYMAVVTVVTGLLCAVVGLFLPMLTASLDGWFDVAQGGYFGFQPMLMASFVALKQAMPESIIALAFVIRVRLKSLPVLTLSLTLVAAAVLPSRGALPMALALPVSWCYLRFFSSLAGPGATGDLRDSFSLASFFPPALQTLVLPVSRFIDSLRCWPAVRASTGAGAGGSSAARAPLLPTTQVAMTQAARDHRAVAMELVNKRLESLERTAGADVLGDTTITFDESLSTTASVAPDASFVDITPIKKAPLSGQSLE